MRCLTIMGANLSDPRCILHEGHRGSHRGPDGEPPVTFFTPCGTCAGTGVVDNGARDTGALCPTCRGTGEV